MDDGRDAKVKVGYPPVHKVEDVCTKTAVELSFDSLRVCVRGELLAGVLSDQKQCVVLGVGDPEFVSTQRADLFCGGVWVDKEGFGCAARIQVLQGYTEEVCLDVQGGLRSGVIPESRPQTALNAGRCAGGATGGECSWPRSSAPGLLAPPGSS